MLDNKKYFYGWGSSYLNNLSKLFMIKPTNQFIKVSILFSLAELAVKNYVRHQSIGEYTEGKKVINMVSQIYINIINN